VIAGRQSGHDLSDTRFSQRFSKYSRFLACNAASTDW
jgi:hypothetical protein